MIIARVSQLAIIQSGRVIANKHERTKLDKLREEMDIPVVELNKIAAEVIGRRINDVRFLSVYETKKVIVYLKSRYEVMSAQYRRMKWE